MNTNENPTSSFGQLEAELSAALQEGDPPKVTALIDAGANLHYKRPHGYDALLDAVQGRDIARDPRLIALLKLLIDRGVSLNGINGYKESGLRVLSRIGRFDAVRLLLEAGADKYHLRWTPLMEAVAIGSLADVEAALPGDETLEEEDYWSRTAWLIAVLTGDIAKARMLLEAGVDGYVCGELGAPPVFYAIRGHHPDMLRWLIAEGAKVHEPDDFGQTALVEAVEQDDLECVEILVEVGAGNRVNVCTEVLKYARSREMLTHLLDVGADQTEVTYDVQRMILGLGRVEEEEDAVPEVSPADFWGAYTRSFGTRNPERMNNPFWDAMIRCGVSASRASRHFAGELSKPVWCANRFGQSLTLLPDGRAVQIGGEHEDFYDSDFCIYNDVFVHDRDGSITIYGYPESVFPPTDFHTATLLGDFIYVIGALGYQEARRFGETPVYRLDLRNMRMDRLDVGGEAPGWIYQHRAAVVSPHEIRIWNGKLVPNKWDTDWNLGYFVLDLERLLWRRVSK